ncbi:hypothetical protein GRX03_15710 [Halovenus sp. WSH3]|uniref:Uncharacterized protein n=1 Tax=Halovenus carboxidivorans TaxID=2692199 RepID=A0A6B0T4Q8_9EURY|nr:hypothetical protein [Halovenus carboxidivorans]MXR53044.1 hypothetical protein [Halovenus carboxidivorans]
MPTRRRFLRRAVVLSLGGPLLGAAAASSDGDARLARGETAVAVRGSPQVIGLTGVPDAVAPQITAANRRYQSLSPAAVEHVSASVRTTGREIQTGLGTAYGSFDPDAIATELEAKTNFRRVTGSRSLSERAATRRSGKRRDGPGPELLTRDTPTAALVVGGQRIDMAHGLSSDDSTERLLSAREQSRSAVPDDAGDSELGAVLDGDVVVHATVGEQTRHALRAELPESATALDTLVRGTRAAGVSAVVGPETTTLRYVLRVDADHRHAVDSLRDELSADESVDELGHSAWSDGLAVEMSVRTAALWAAHERLLAV